jgi:hypothetical protein
MNDQEIPCKYCGEQTPMLDTKLCDPCWELGRRIEAAPELALKILTKLNKTPLPPRRPATKIEIEAMQSICNRQDELEEARKIIRSLRQAIKFLKQHKLELAGKTEEK